MIFFSSLSKFFFYLVKIKWANHALMRESERERERERETDRQTGRDGCNMKYASSMRACNFNYKVYPNSSRDHVINFRKYRDVFYILYSIIDSI